MRLLCHATSSITSLLAVYMSAIRSIPCLTSQVHRTALWASTVFWGRPQRSIKGTGMNDIQMAFWLVCLEALWKWTGTALGSLTRTELQAKPTYKEGENFFSFSNSSVSLCSSEQQDSDAKPHNNSENRRVIFHLPPLVIHGPFFRRV